jgi:diguanylate cyclase (GGDEF)-like protein
MNLDVQTLSVVTVFVTALLGALLVFAGLQNRSIRAPMWWGAAHIVNAIGLALLIARGVAPDFLTIGLANALVLFGYGLTWTGARVFDEREVSLYRVLLAPAIWTLLCLVPGFVGDDNLGVVVVSTTLAVFAFMTAQEFWRGRDEQLMSRWPSIFARVPATLLSPTFADDTVLRGLSFALLTFGTLLFTVVMAFLQLNMTKERTELKHKINSLVDPLSGVANRRAFLDDAADLLTRQEEEREPLAVMLFDLDHFKQINDRFGHAVGDAVLQTFAGTATATLGADALFARIGGEEFACCMAVGDLDEAFAIADRVRRNFAAAAARFGADELLPTVSGGVTLGCDPRARVLDLLSVVDRALYRAKENGRNRVETETPKEQAMIPSSPSIVPIIEVNRGTIGPTATKRWRAAS